ncbi:hypothetical protein C5S35_14305 [Candidatus Methanophagaceae archaeon]|jgi:hypothetical protein|nr:hypothetical protein C5S35_14305 [Methanophagales archaeon]
MDVDIALRVDKLEVDVEMLKRRAEPSALHEYITNELKRVKPENITEIEERIRNHELLKKSITTKLTVEDPQSVLDEVREE